MFTPYIPACRHARWAPAASRCVYSVRNSLYSTLCAVVIYMSTSYTTTCGHVEHLWQAGVCRVSESLTFLNACSRDVCSHTLHTCARTCATSTCKEQVSVGCQKVSCFLLHSLVMCVLTPYTPAWEHVRGRWQRTHDKSVKRDLYTWKETCKIDQTRPKNVENPL